jgi:pimeloyl-ACP methyl ester carboxylesterase
MSALSTTHRCVGVDLKGYGQSEKRAGDYRHEGAAEQLYAMLQLIGVHKFNLVTHDRGTVQADFITANHPEAVLRYARGEQHLYHFNPILAPQGDTFRDAPWTGLMEDPKRFALYVYTWIAKIPIPDEEMARVIQEFSYPGIVRAVPRYFNSSTFRQEWLTRRNRLLKAWKCPVVIMQGYESRTQPREFYEKAREYIPNAKDVRVRYMPGGHFWTLESPKETTEAIRLLLSM